MFDPDIQLNVRGEVCPPVDAVPSDGEFYRWIMDPPCNNRHFDSDIKRNAQPPRALDRCESWACSVFDSPAGMNAIKKRVKTMARTGHWVRASLTRDHGVISPTGDHRDFWKYIGANVVPCCVVV